jgi:DNA-binding PadR family transcriptional regulator
LLKDKAVSAEWGLSARNRKVRIYKITPVGRKRLEHETSSFEQMLEGIARVMKPVRS